MTIPPLVIELRISLVKIGFVFGLLVVFFAPMLAWVERKQSAVMQDRVGANRAGVFGFTVIGLLHSLSDVIKLIFKEDFIPRGAERGLHMIAPVIALIPSLVAFTVIPFGGQYTLWGHHVNLVIADLDVGLLYVFAISSLATYGVVIAGWASNNNWSLLGGMRASAQMFSYEVTMGLTIIGVVMFYQSLSLTQIVAKQENFWHWGVIWHFPAFILFLTCAVAENKRVPFDTPEAESELVAGYFTEYSGMKFIMFWTAEFLEMVTISGMCVALFLGGHHIPFLTQEILLGLFAEPLGPNWSQVAVMLIGVGVFVTKLIALLVFQMVIRWTMPRFRYDQIMKLGWKMILPLSLAWIFLVGCGILLGLAPRP